MVLTIFSFVLCLPASFAQSWSLSKDKKGVKVYTRPSSTSNLKDAKAVVTINATVQDAIDLLNNFSGYPSWMHECSEGKLLKRVSETEYYVYNVTNAPFPVSDRDLIVHTTATQAADGTVTLNMVGDADYIAEKRGIVRIPNFKGYWKIAPKGEKQIEVTYEFASDPGGSIPAWLANQTSTDLPLNTLINMKNKLEN